MEGHAHLCALIEGKDDSLLQVEPVVGAYSYPQQAEAANSEHAAQQRQRLPATKAHTTASKAGGGGTAGRKESWRNRREIKKSYHETK